MVERPVQVATFICTVALTQNEAVMAAKAAATTGSTRLDLLIRSFAPTNHHLDTTFNTTVCTRPRNRHVRGAFAVQLSM